MGEIGGFLKIERVGIPYKSALERVELEPYKEFVESRPDEELAAQGARCMECGVPFCHNGCPLGNLIPDFNDLVYHKDWEAAIVRLHATNNFPEFTGRLCPAPCEAACVLALNRDAVTIEEVEKTIIERAFAEGWVTPRPRAPTTGKTVAVVGSGPAGLAAARGLALRGHAVTVFERDEAPGGLLRFGIPDFKLERTVLDRRLRLLEAEGVTFRCGVRVGAAPTWSELRQRHDAVVLAIGAGRPRLLEVPGAELSGVVQAVPWLSQANRAVRDGGGHPQSAQGKRVVILGGGDTGADCLGTALRQGAATVTQVELLPEPPRTRAPRNPWPQWPQVLRTSSSHEEGGARRFGRRTTRLEGEGGRVTRLVSVGVEQRDGRLVDLPGTEETLPADLVLLAMGFLGPDASALAAELGVTLDARGVIAVDSRFATSAPGVFAVGDARRGAHLIVSALADGRDAAAQVDLSLR